MLAAATYENATASAIPGDRSFAVSVNDGVADSNIATTTITVIPDYLSVAASKLHTNEDVPVNLGLTIDPDLFSGGALEDVVGVATGYRADSAGTAATSFTIPDNVTSIVITGYSNRPNNTAINDNFNDDYQILSTRVDLAAGTTSGTLSHIAHLTSGGAACRRSVQLVRCRTRYFRSDRQQYDRRRQRQWNRSAVPHRRQHAGNRGEPRSPDGLSRRIHDV